MEFLSTLVLLLLTLTGYAIGATLSAPGKRLGPGLFDFAAVLVLWVAAYLTRAGLGKWLAILVWLGAGMLAGLLVTRLQSRKKRNDDPFIPPDGVTSPIRLAWHRWVHFSARFGDYQSRVILTLLYFTVVLPFGLGVRLFSDPLNTHKAPAESAWHPWEMSSKNIEEGRRQF